jgi:hypothetical protein
LKSSPADALVGRFERFEPARARACVVHAPARCLIEQHNRLICRYFKAGATGLEPATSGVTAESGTTTFGDERRRPAPFAGIFHTVADRAPHG